MWPADHLFGDGSCGYRTLGRRVEQRPGSGTLAGSGGRDKTGAWQLWEKMSEHDKVTWEVSLWPQGMHVRKEDWRQGPAFWKLRHSARPFPITYPTWVDVCRRPSEVGALIPWNLASWILSGLPLADAHRAARVSWWRWRRILSLFGSKKV